MAQVTFHDTLGGKVPSEVKENDRGNIFNTYNVGFILKLYKESLQISLQMINTKIKKKTARKTIYNRRNTDRQ